MMTMTHLKSLLSVLAFAAVAACSATEPSTSGVLAAEEQPLPPYEPKALVVDLPETATGPAKEEAPTPSAPGFALTAGESYFMVMFGYQGKGPFNLPRHSHTFTMFVKASGASLATADLSTFTISWLPQDGLVGIGQPIKPGRNYTFAESMAIVAANDYDVRRSRVVKIAPYLYEKAASRYNKLQQGSYYGSIDYKMIDDNTGRKRILSNQTGAYTNCIHAVSDSLVYSNGTLLNTGTKRGFAASDAVYEFFSWYMPEEGLGYDNVLASRLGL